MLVTVGVAANLNPPLFGIGGPVSPLSVVASVAPLTGYTPLVVVLTATIEGGHPPYSASWSSDLGGIGTGSRIPYTLLLDGNHTFTVRVTDAGGASASTQVVVGAVSPYPQASYLIPSAATDLGPILTIRWTASSTLSACVLPGYGSLAIPPFMGCGVSRGVVHTGLSDAAAFGTDGDDPEPTPVLFQSGPPGVGIALAWWYNDTAGPETHGTVDLSTQVASL